MVPELLVGQRVEGDVRRERGRVEGRGEKKWGGLLHWLYMGWTRAID